MILDALTPADVEAVRTWRNRDDCRMGLRTSYVLTQEMQAQWYRDVICHRASAQRYFAVREDAQAPIVAQVGLTNIAWENGTAEISLIVAPAEQQRGIGRAAVRLALREGFERSRLQRISGEVYHCNPEALTFWLERMEEYTTWRRGHPPSWGDLVTVLPDRKWWRGRYWHATWFVFTADTWKPNDAGGGGGE